MFSSDGNGLKLDGGGLHNAIHFSKKKKFNCRIIMETPTPPERPTKAKTLPDSNQGCLQCHCE
jgi:hypothetical protein